MILESMAALVVALGIRVGTDVATNIENRIISSVIDVVNKKQLPSLTTLEGTVRDLQRRQRDLLTEQVAMRADQRKQIEAPYKNGVVFLDDARRTNKRKRKIGLIDDARKEFTNARNLEVGEAAARAALLVGACYHLLYCIDAKHGKANENHWYGVAFQLAEQSLGSDGKPPRELIRELLGLPYLSGKYETFEVYWQKWDPPKLIDAPKDFVHRKLLEASKLSESPKVVDAPAIFDEEKYLQSHPRGLSREQRTLLFVYANSTSRLNACMKCGGPFSQQGDVQQLYCRKCRQKPWGK
jgi:hypothetical protein